MNGATMCVYTTFRCASCPIASMISPKRAYQIGRTTILTSAKNVKERNVLWIVHNINKTIQRIKSDTIMGKIRICSKPPKPIVSLSETYTVLSSYKSGRVTLCLTPDGEYLFTVYGDISESTAKRSSTHKATEQKMTNIMLKMYEDAQDAYTVIQRRVNYVWLHRILFSRM